MVVSNWLIVHNLKFRSLAGDQTAKIPIVHNGRNRSHYLTIGFSVEGMTAGIVSSLHCVMFS